MRIKEEHIKEERIKAVRINEECMVRRQGKRIKRMPWPTWFFVGREGARVFDLEDACLTPVYVHDPALAANTPDHQVALRG